MPSASQSWIYNMRRTADLHVAARQVPSSQRVGYFTIGRHSVALAILLIHYATSLIFVISVGTYQTDAGLALDSDRCRNSA